MEWNPEPDTWRRSYAERGYLVVENAVDPDLLQQMRDVLERIDTSVAEERLPPNLRRWITLERDRVDRYVDRVESSTISNIMELPRFDPVFRDLIIYPRVLDI